MNEPFLAAFNTSLRRTGLAGKTGYLVFTVILSAGRENIKTPSTKDVETAASPVRPEFEKGSHGSDPPDCPVTEFESLGVVTPFCSSFGCCAATEGKS